jgi:integrase
MARPLDVLYTEPEICPKDPTPEDMDKDWFVQLRFYDTSQKKWVPKPFKKGINYIKKFKARLAAANSLKESLKKQLEKGWNPLTGTMPIDQLVNPLNNNFAQLPLEKAIEQALKECKVSKGTIKEYRSTVKFIIGASKKTLTPTEAGDCSINYSVIAIGDIKKYHIKLILEQAFRDNKWTNKGWNKHLGNLQGVLSRLVDNDVFEHNPAHDIKKIDVPEPDKFNSLSEEDKKIIREDIYLHHYGYFVYLMTLYHTGLRPFEALAVKIPDIQFDQRIIKISPDDSRENSKTKNVRQVPITNDLYVLLKSWVEGSEETDYYLFGSCYTSGRGNKGSVKGGATGAMHPEYFKPSNTRIKRDTVTKLWKSLVRDHFGVDHYQYDLKGTGGDDKIMAGVDMDALRDQYGHQNRRMSERYAKRIKEIYKNEIINKSPSF